MFGLFSGKKKNSISQEEKDKLNRSHQLANLLAPNAGFNEYDFLRIGDRYIKGFYMDGYPAEIDFAFLSGLVTFNGDCDVMLYINPAENDSVIRTLNGRIEGIETKLNEREKDRNSRGVSSMRREYFQLDQLRTSIDNASNRILYFDVFATLAHRDLNKLEERSDRLISRIGATKDHLKPADDQHDLMFKAVSPLAIKEVNNWVPFDLAGAANLYPFISAEWPHEKGALLGLNADTKGPVMFDGFNKKHVLNYGIFAVAASRRGKSALIKKIMTGELRYDIFPAVLDPMNEFKPVIEAFGGAYHMISRTSETKVNPAEIMPEWDDNKKSMYLDIYGKIENMTMITGTMLGINATGEEQKLSQYETELLALVGKAWRDVYTDPKNGMGLTTDPNSLYQAGEVGDTMVERRRMKKQRQYEDFYHRFCQLVEGDKDFKGAVMALEAWLAGREYGLFDCQTNIDLRKTPGIGFGLQELKNSILLPVGMQSVISHLEERFLKKKSATDGSKFRVIVDEAQEMLVNSISAKFMDTAFRQFAKKAGGPVAVTQNFQKFWENPYGKAVIQNSDTKIIGGQQPADVRECIRIFDLTEGEATFVKQGLEHHFLLKQPNYSCRMVTQFSPMEQKVFFTSHGS